MIPVHSSRNHVSAFWDRFLAFVLISGITALLWLTLGAVATLTCLSITLLLVLFYYQRQLAALDKWLQAEKSTLPDSSGKWGDVFARLLRLVRDQRQSQQQITSALERLQRATSAMPEGVVITDEMDRIEWCNPVAEKHLGINARVDAGQHITHLVRYTQFGGYLAAGEYDEPLVMKQPRQQGLILSLQVVPYGDKQKLLISRDITRLEKIQSMRRDFVANVSHELRTPLTVIGGFLETLSEDDHVETEASRLALRLMTDQTQRMQRLVEDLLTLSRLEDTENLARDDVIDIPKMLRELYHEAQSLSGGRHAITLNLDAGAKLTGCMDELRSAFSNLISNAIRYTPERGAISLNWKTHDDQAVFSVQDSGIGIEPEHVPRLTERFYRADRGRSRETGGTGLGLAIVKHVLTCHQAKLEIASEPGKGSSFSAWFPKTRLIMADQGAPRISPSAEA